jgi:hypothetical protein
MSSTFNIKQNNCTDTNAICHREPLKRDREVSEESATAEKENAAEGGCSAERRVRPKVAMSPMQQLKQAHKIMLTDFYEILPDGVICCKKPLLDLLQGAQCAHRLKKGISAGFQVSLMSSHLDRKHRVSLADILSMREESD